jgi:hypothetical protein
VFSVELSWASAMANGLIFFGTGAIKPTGARWAINSRRRRALMSLIRSFLIKWLGRR